MSVPSSITLFIIISLTSVCLQGTLSCTNKASISQNDADLIEFALNLEYLEAEFFLFGSKGYGLDKVAPNLTMGGPAPIGVRMAKLDGFTRDIIYQFGLQEISHLRAIKNAVEGFQRPLLNLSASTFAAAMNKAFGKTLEPPFDPYANSINYLIASYFIPYVGLTGYVGANPRLNSSVARSLVAGLLGVESGQDAVIRTLLYQKAAMRVKPYEITVAEFTYRISKLRDYLGGHGVRDEGIMVSRGRGPEGSTRGNVLAGDRYSLSYGRAPKEILRIVYASGNEYVPDGFFPHGADGRIARSYLLREKKVEF